jgi:hypothetical protein
MTLLETVGAPSRPRVSGPVPGPRSCALLARQARRESSAGVYPRPIPIAVVEVPHGSGSSGVARCAPAPDDPLLCSSVVTAEGIATRR